MNKVRKNMVRVKKTEKLDQVKLNRIARKYNISPLSVRELQLGFPEEIPVVAVEKLEKDGYVTRVKSKLRSPQERMNPSTTKYIEPIVTSDDIEIETIKIDVDTIDSSQNNEEQI